MKLSKFSKYLDILYTDKMCITRYTEVESEDGSTEEIVDPDPLLKDIPCRISKVKLDEHKLNIEDVNKQNIKLKVFCSLDIEVKKGDSLTIERVIDEKVVDTIKAIAGEPMKYDISQEILLIEDGEA